MAFSCDGKAPIICAFCHKEKKKTARQYGKNDSTRLQRLNRA
jgi:hypothetical protein